MRLPHKQTSDSPDWHSHLLLISAIVSLRSESLETWVYFLTKMKIKCKYYKRKRGLHACPATLFSKLIRSSGKLWTTISHVFSQKQSLLGVEDHMLTQRSMTVCISVPRNNGNPLRPSPTNTGLFIFRMLHMKLFCCINYLCNWTERNMNWSESQFTWTAIITIMVI